MMEVAGEVEDPEVQQGGQRRWRGSGGDPLACQTSWSAGLITLAVRGTLASFEGSSPKRSARRRGAFLPGIEYALCASVTTRGASARERLASSNEGGTKSILYCRPALRQHGARAREWPTLACPRSSC